MCRMLIYKGPVLPIGRLILDQPHSMWRQASEAKEMLSGPLNADGFGVAWYNPGVDDQPAVYRSIQPIWLDPNVKSMFPRIEAGLFFAHVRAASDGMPVSPTNTHPFTFNNLTFMHNGFVDGFREKIFVDFSTRIKPEFWPMIKGNTDSEHLFALWLSQLANTENPSKDDQLEALRRTITIVNELAGRHAEEAILNIAITDGQQAMVSRHHFGKRKATLYLNTGDRQFPGSVLIASEPLYESPTWQPVAENSVVIIGPSTEPTFHSLE